MGAEYDLWLLHHADGHVLTRISTYSAFQYAKVVNDIGSFSVTVPSSFDISLVQRDTRLVIYRTPPEGTKALDFVGFVRYISKEVRGQSMNYVIQGPCLNDLLRRRIVAYAAGTAQAAMAAVAADDMMKAIVTDNLGGDAAAARQITSYGFSIQANATAGTVVTKSFSWMNVLEVLKKIADLSQTTAATAAYFGAVPLSTGWLCEFRTNVNQWGADHRHPDGPAGPVIFSLAFRNLENVTRNINYRDEVTYVYAGGQDVGTSRNIQEATDATRAGKSPFNRCEAFVDANNSTTDAAVLGDANSAVRKGRPRRLFSANLANVGDQIYGRDFGHGDYITCVFDGETIDARIDAVSVTVNGNNENVQMMVREESTE